MQFPALITGVERRSGVSKKSGQSYDMVTVTAVDRSVEGKCSTPIEFTLQKEDMDLADTIDGQDLVLELRKIGTYQGRLDPVVRIAREKPVAPKPQAGQAAK